MSERVSSIFDNELKGKDLDISLNELAKILVLYQNINISND